MLTSDLMFASRAEAVGRELSVPVWIVGDGLSAAQFFGPDSENSPTVVVIDLETANLDVAETVQAIRAASPSPPRILAYGPHVQEARLEAARAAGCDDVLSRGQFHRQMAEILRNHGG
jgi:CheY-like chemotaxis protein